MTQSLTDTDTLTADQPLTKQKGNEMETTTEYWDCECEINYIHPSIEMECKICDCRKDEQPDSIVSEVIAAGWRISSLRVREWSAEEILQREG